MGITESRSVTLYATMPATRAKSLNETFVGSENTIGYFRFIPNPRPHAGDQQDPEAGVNLRFDDILSGGDHFRAS